jgi:hypothetical protein
MSARARMLPRAMTRSCETKVKTNVFHRARWNTGLETTFRKLRSPTKSNCSDPAEEFVRLRKTASRCRAKPEAGFDLIENEYGVALSALRARSGDPFFRRELFDNRLEYDGGEVAAGIGAGALQSGDIVEGNVDDILRDARWHTAGRTGPIVPAEVARTDDFRTACRCTRHAHGRAHRFGTSLEKAHLFCARDRVAEAFCKLDLGDVRQTGDAA